MNPEPLVSVLIPAYNSEAYIGEAVRSVLSQTLDDLELVVADDCSTDGTREVVRSFNDPRIRLIENQENIGSSATLHRSFPLCRGQFVARMDNDDICEPERLARQVAFLRAHPEVSLVGGAVQSFGNIERPYTHVFPQEHEDIRATLLFYCSLAHPALMFRREIVAQGLIAYDDDFRYADDYHLWNKLLTQVRAANLPELVLRYRLHAGQIRLTYSGRQYEASVRVRKGLLDQVGVVWREEDIALHESIVTASYGADWGYLNRVAIWFARITEANRHSKYWQEDALLRILSVKCGEIGRQLGLRRNPSEVGPELNHFLQQCGYRGDSWTIYFLRHAKRLLKRWLTS